MHVFWFILHDKCDYVGQATFGASLGYVLVKVRSRSVAQLVERWTPRGESTRSRL